VLALKQPRQNNANGVVAHFKKLGAVVVSKVATTDAVIHKLAIAKDDPTFAASIIEFVPKLVRKIIK
jgi:hypothetical protein